MNEPEGGKRLGKAWAPLLLVGAFVVLLPLMAVFELPLERQVKNFVGIEYKEPNYCPPPRDRGQWGAWRREGRLPNLLEESRAVRRGDSIYLIGGVVTPVVDNFGRATASFRRYDIASGRFAELPSLPRRLNHVGMGLRGNHLYVVGGLGDLLEYRSVAADSMWRYDFDSKTWEELPPMPTARGAHGAAIVGDTLYAIGGRDGPDSYDTVEAYDIERGVWSSRAPLPGPGRDHLGVAAMGGYVYAVGGRRDDAVEFDDFYRYDPRTDTWTELPPLPVATSGANLDRVGNELVVSGGEGSENQWVTGRTYAFDPARGSWRRLPSSPRPKHGQASAGYRDRLYVLGGSRCGGSTPVDTIESLQVN